MAVIPYLREHENLHNIARRDPMQLRMASPKFYETWTTRVSEIPFGVQSIYRLRWDHATSTLRGGSGNLIHPSLNRGLTVRELSSLMGWPDIPRGPDPIAQIGKGIVPVIGEWLAEQVEFCLIDVWNGADWESSFNPKTLAWEGRDTHHQIEKVFNLTRYVNPYRRDYDA